MKHITEKEWNKFESLFVKKISMPKPVKILWYIKCCSFIKTICFKSPSNSNFQL